VPPDCPVCQRSNDYSATVDSNGNLKSATVRGQCAQSQSRRQKAHRTMKSTCPVHHRIVRWARLLELQRSNPNGWVTWLAYRTVSGAPIDSSPTPTVGLVVGAINPPTHHHFKASKLSAIAFNTRALDFTPRHKTKDQILSKSQTHSKDLVTCERERDLCSFEFLSLGSLFFFLHSCSQATCNQRKRHQVVVVLVRGLRDPLIKEKSSLGLGDRLREGKG
jgi:hypothetical protein